MQPKSHFQNYAEYLVGLLSIMGELNEAPRDEVLKHFEQKFGKFIPLKDRKSIKSGPTRWVNNLEWGRYDLNQLGLMSSPGRGTWAISEDGLIWLKQHEGYNHAVRSMRSMLNEKARVKGENQTAYKEHEFKWQRKTIRGDGKALSAYALQELQLGNPPEARRFREWYAEIEGRQVSTKWLFHLLTGAEYNEFVTYQAISILRKLGISIHNLEKNTSEVSNIQVKTVRSNPKKVITDFEKLQSLIEEKNSLVHLAKITREKNALQVNFPNLPASQYEFRFRREHVEISFQLMSLIPRVNHERIELLKPLASQWSQALGQEVLTERWGKRWARVYFIADYPSLHGNFEQMLKAPNLFAKQIGQTGVDHPDWHHDKITADAFSTLIDRFIEITYNDLVAYISRRKRKNSINRSTGDYINDHQSHHLLDQKIAEIRNFLSGRAVRTPKDEELCDWVQLSYLFGLSTEGLQLFKFIQPQALNNEWLYKRTKRYADLCRLKSPLKANGNDN